MAVSEYLDTFFGRPVLDFTSGDTVTDQSAVYRLRQEYDAEQSQAELLTEFLGQVVPEELEALMLGAWSDMSDNSCDDFLEALVARAAQLPQLRALFIGDLTYEDSEISWIIQGNYATLLAAFPALEVLRIRGGESLFFPAVEHPALRELVIETGGLPSRVVNAIAESTLPALRHLELWLGDENYGFDGDIDTYRQLLERIRPERLHYLGLRNATISDELAIYLATQPWLGKLHTLDLSMGTLGDDGARALLASPYLEGLQVLDLEYHYISDELVAQLQRLPCEVRIGEAEEEYDGDRYVQVGE